MPQQATQQPIQQRECPQPRPAPQPGPAAKNHRRLPIAIAACIAVVAIVAVVVLVVLPRTTKHGLWVVTKQVTTTERGDRKSVITSTYTTDGEGKTLVSTYDIVDDEGSNIYDLEVSYTYDYKGFCKTDNIKSAIPTAPSGGSSNSESTTTHDCRWSFSDGGIPEQLARTSTDGDTVVYTYHYDDKGHIVKKTQNVKNGDVHEESVIDYDENGLVTRQTRENGLCTLETTYKYEADQSGKPTKCSYETIDASTGKKTEECVSTYEYDEGGNVKGEFVEKTEYSDDGSVSEKSTESTEYEGTYIDSPSPWLVQIARLGNIPYPDAF